MIRLLKEKEGMAENAFLMHCGTFFSLVFSYTIQELVKKKKKKKKKKKSSVSQTFALLNIAVFFACCLMSQSFQNQGKEKEVFDLKKKK